MKYSLIIFDWDGTLMDSLDKIVTSVKDAAVATGLSTPSTEAIRNIIGLSLNTAMVTLFPNESIQTQLAIESAYRQEFRSNNVPTPFYTGIKSWLAELKAQGYMLAVATGKGRNGLDRVLKENDVADLFAITYSAEQAKSKPDPLMLHNILEQLDISPESALMIGDSSYDLEMANNAGVDCLGVNYGVHSVEILSQFSPIAIVSDLPNELGAYI